MHKIISPPSDMIYLAMVIFGVLSVPGLLPGSPVPVWSSVFFMFMFFIGLLALRKISVDEEKLEAHQFITGRRTIIYLKDVETVRVVRMPHTISSLIGLVKQGRLMTVTDSHGKKLNVSNKSTKRFQKVLDFLQEQLPGKVTDLSRS